MNNRDKVLITTIGMLLENEEPDYKKIFQDYCKDKIADLGTIDIPDEIWGEEEINTWDIIMTTDGIAEFSDLRVINKEELNEDDNLIAIDKDNNIVLNTPMLTSLGYAARMEFNQIDREYYNKILEYWNDIYFDEMMAGYIDESDKLNEDYVKEDAIDYVIPNYTGGGVYEYIGKLKDGNYFMASDDYFSAENSLFDIRIVDTNPDDAIEDYGYPEWQEAHLVRDLSESEAKEFTVNILNWIVNNMPEGNYDMKNIKNKLEVIYD